MHRKMIVVALAVVIATFVCVENGLGQRSRSSSSGSRSSSSSGSRSSFSSPSSSSRPKYTSPSSSGSSASSSRPKYSSGGSPSSSQPKYTSPSSSGSSASSSKPKYTSPSSSGGSSASSSKPKYTSPSSSGGSSASSSKPKYTSPSSSGGSASPSKYTSSSNSGSSAPSALPTTGNSRPIANNGGAKERAASAQASKRTYEATKAATLPPKSTYTSQSGKPVNVRTDSSTVQTMRSRPSSYYTPESRNQRTSVHIHNYGYSRPYDWYYSQPTFYVGGGYSSAFWWMMMEWSAERRAHWFYHNQHNIERDAYKRGIKDAAVAAEIAKLKTQNVQPNPDYVDKEFVDNPDLMYEQDYVEAAYNPVVVERSSGSGGKALLWVIVVGVIVGLTYVLVFRVRWGR